MYMYIDVLGASDKNSSIIRYANSKDLVESGKYSGIYIETIQNVDKDEILLLSISYGSRLVIKIWMETKEEVNKWYDALKKLTKQQSERNIYHKVPERSNVYIPGR